MSHTPSYFSPSDDDAADGYGDPLDESIPTDLDAFWGASEEVPPSVALWPGETEPQVVTLTTKQQGFMNLATGYKEAGIRILVLQGEGGSGKTFVLAQLARTVKDMVFCAPTHQARNVLFENLVAAGLENPIVTTVAALLGKVPDKSRPPGGDVLELNFIYAGGGDVFSPEGIVLVADEASMIDLPDIKALAARNRNGLTILSGDPYQLPPVQGTAAWDALENTIAAGQGAKVVLDRNMRSEEPDLTAWINEVRRTGELPTEPCAHVTYYTSRQLWHEAIRRHVQERGARNVIALAYTNASVNATAALVRNAEGYPEHQAIEGEVLRINSTHAFLDWHEVYRQLLRENYSRDEAFQMAGARVRRHQLQTGDLIEVLEAYDPVPCRLGWAFKAPWRQEVRARILTGEFQGQDCTLHLAELGNLDPVKGLLEECRDVINLVLAGERKDPRALSICNPNLGDQIPSNGQLWGKHFYGARDMFCLASNAVALTVHRAQGSGRDVVFIDWSDISGPEARQLKYTAVSRARQQLHILRTR